MRDLLTASILVSCAFFAAVSAGSPFAGSQPPSFGARPASVPFETRAERPSFFGSDRPWPQPAPDAAPGDKPLPPSRSGDLLLAD